MIRLIFILLLLTSYTECTDPSLMEEEVMGDTVEVIQVDVSGQEMNYNFNVRLSSPDTGCDQYADWWEVIDEKGKLIYRRNLAHSHVEEQPFSRSGGPIAIGKSDIIIVRGHMNNTSYGTIVFKGSMIDGFLQTNIASDFAVTLASEEPLPPKCAF